MLGHRDRMVPAFASRQVDIAAFKVHESGAQQHRLSQPGIIVALCGHVTIGTGAGFFRSHSVRDERTECLPAEAFGGNGLLLVVTPTAVRVLRANQYRTGGPHGCDAITGDGAVDAEHVDVVAQNLEVVGGPILGGQPLVMQHRHLLVCGHLEMTAKAGRDPCGVTAKASHTAIVVCERTYIVAAPGGAVLLDGFREAGLLVVVRVSGGNGILDLNDFPLLAWIHHGALEETIIPGVKLPLAPWGAKDLQVRAAFGRCRPRGHQGSASGDTTVAIDAVDLNGVASLSVQLSIPVSILGEMAVNAMHSFFEVNVLEMHGPAEFVGILGRDDIVLFIEQIALAILLVNRAEDPAVAMKIGKLGVLKSFRELWAADFFKEANIGP